MVVGERIKAQHDKGHLSMDESLATPLEEKHNDRTSRDGASNHG